jgi:hypothetical protein
MDSNQLEGVTGPVELAERLRRQVADRRTAMRQGMFNRPLSVSPPPDCPKDLAERIDGHNAAVAAWEAECEGLGDDAAGLAMSLTKPDVRGAVLGEKAAGLRARRYDFAQRLIDLVGSRGKLLEAVREHLAPLIQAAEADLAKVTDKAEKALVKAGWQPQAARVASRGAYPQAEANQLRAMAEQTEPVRKAAEALAALTAADSQAREVLGAQVRDAEIAGAEALAAWYVLVGRL